MVKESKKQKECEAKTEEKKTINNSLATLVIKNVSLVLSFLVVTWFGVEVLDYSLQMSDSKQYVEKRGLNTKLSTIIRNGADLELVKHTFDVRPLIHPRLFKKLDTSQYYSEKDPLSLALNDICVDYLSSDPFEEDSLFYARLVSIIQDNQYHNPFDKLEDSQKPFFKNVMALMGNDYAIIQEDMVRIGDELSYKNQLVGKYLNKSNTSFIISITALVLTLLSSAYQIYQGKKLMTLTKPSPSRKHIVIQTEDNRKDNNA